MEAKTEYMPENNLVVLLLLLLLTGGLYYFWWLVRASRIFGDNPVSNVMLVIFTAGLWAIYLNLKYMQKSEEINSRDMKWYMVLFLPMSVLIIQNNINERFFPGK
jgi:MFS superfamily sulfate permease-like transporter